MARLVNPSRKSAALSAPRKLKSPLSLHKLVKTKKPSWKALVRTFICCARKLMPTRMLCFPRIMSNESAIEKTLVPPWKGAKPRSPSDQYGPPTMVEVNPQLTQSDFDCDSPGGAFGQLLSRFAPGMPSFADSQLRSPNDLMWLKIRLKPAVNWLMLLAEKTWVSEIAALRPWLLMFWVLPKAFASANPGEPPGTNELAWS